MPDNPNEQVIIAPPGDEPMSLDQLLDLFKVDREVWKVDRFQPNSWPIGVKVEEKDIKFTEGVIDGYVRGSGEINTKRLYQAKAWLSRRVLIPSKVPIHHISVKIRKTKQQKPKPIKKINTALLLPDPQFGFLKAINQKGAVPLHDRVAIDAVHQVAKVLEPDAVGWPGDILDLSEWSTHFVHRPEFQMTTQAALIEAAWTIGYFVASFPSAEHIVMVGNHDDRLEQFMIRNMQQAYMIRPADQLGLGALMAVDNLLGLRRMGVHYVGNYPDGEWWFNDYFKMIHGSVARARPGATASAVIQGATVSQFFGHIHRAEIVSEHILERGGARDIWAATSGCLCHTDGRVPGSSKDRNWQKAAAVVQYDDAGFVGYPEFITIQKDGSAIFRGSRFQGRDRFDDLVASVDGQFDWRAYETLDFNG